MKKTTDLLTRTTLVGNLNIARARRWAAFCLATLLATTAPPARAAVTEAWVHRYNAVVTNSTAYAGTVVRNAAGDIIVIGSTDDGITGSDLLTIKYSGADGSVLWQNYYNGPANSDDVPGAVATDASGNVVVTGTSAGDYYTVKYAAADGALLWEKRYHGPANGHDGVGLSSSLALGPNGMVAITGSSDGDFGAADIYDYATVVYWETLPPVAVEFVPMGVRLHFTGVPGRSYRIERAPAVNGPWTSINMQTGPTSGLLDYTDTAPPAGSAFYRTVQP